MLPDNTLSDIPVRSSFVVPLRDSLLVDYSLHPEDKKLITCKYENNQVFYEYDGTIVNVIFLDSITALSFTLDLNKRPLLVYVRKDNTYMYWFNSAIGKMDTTLWGLSYKYPQVALDEIRVENSSQSDVVFAYVKDNELCVRYQRDRFTIPTILSNVQRLEQIGMLRNNRFGFNTYYRMKPKDMP